MLAISAAVEGTLDEAVIGRLINESGATIGPVYGKSGKEHLRQKIRGYNNAAKHSPWIVLVDLDHDANCAPNLRESWFQDFEPRLCFRIAVREIEAWLLADRERIARFLSVPIARIPRDPETQGDPKQIIVNLAARSRRREVRDDMTPRPQSGRSVGPAYTSKLIEFVNAGNGGWRPNRAAIHSDSLRRAIECIRRLIEQFS